MNEDLIGLIIKIVQVYIEGYLQAMLDSQFRQDYLKVKVTDEEVRYHRLLSLCYEYYV